MHTRQELIKGYETEIRYQRHMLENLGRWFSVLFLMASIGGLLIYFFHKTSLLFLILGSLIALFGIVGMLVVGYGMYRGRANLQKVEFGWLKIESTSKRLRCFFLDYF